MNSVSVGDPRARQWRVAVRMLPWKPRWRGLGRRDYPQPSSADAPDEPRAPRHWYSAFDFLDIFEGWVLVVAAVVLILLVLPLFIFIVEVLIVAVLLTIGVLIRVLFRQPWLVDARANDGTSLSWKVVGYARSRRVVQEVASLLSKGVAEPRVMDAELVR